MNTLEMKKAENEKKEPILKAAEKGELLEAFKRYAVIYRRVYEELKDK